MKSMMSVVKTALTGYLLFLVPLVATVLILSEAMRYAAQLFLRPVEQIR
jgi:hypothetical protein